MVTHVIGRGVRWSPFPQILPKIPLRRDSSRSATTNILGQKKVTRSSSEFSFFARSILEYCNFASSLRRLQSKRLLLLADANYRTESGYAKAAKAKRMRKKDSEAKTQLRLGVWRSELGANDLTFSRTKQERMSCRCRLSLPMIMIHHTCRPTSPCHRRRKQVKKEKVLLDRPIHICILHLKEHNQAH